MTVQVRQTREVSHRFPRHVTGLLRVSSSAPLQPRPTARDNIVQRIRHVGGLNAARHSVEYWREVYAAMGAKPKYRPSVQLLLETYAEHGRITVPVPIVELYCWYSLARGIPMAGYRPDRIRGMLRLCLPGRGQPFTPLGQPRAQPELTKTGEVAYVDDEKVVCRYWNYRDCDQTKLVPGVCDALFIFDFVNADGVTHSERAREVMATFASYFDGNVQVAMATLDGTDALDAEL